MKRAYQLIKLRTSTVEDLKRLKNQMGQPSLDHLIKGMVRFTDAHRLGLKDVNWDAHSKRWDGEE